MAFSIYATVHAHTAALTQEIARAVRSVNATIQVNVTGAAGLAQLNRQLATTNATLQTTGHHAQVATTRLGTLGTAAGQTTTRLGGVQQALNRTTRATQQTAGAAITGANAMYQFGHAGGLALRRFAAFTVATTLVFGFVYAIGGAVKAAVEFERQMIRVWQVTGRSTAFIQGLSKDISFLSTTLGVSSEKLSTLSVVLGQAGLSGYELQAALSSVAKTDLTATFTDMQATAEGLIAIKNQFKIGASEYEEALASINRVASKFAVESDDIIAAVRKMGSVFASASGDFDDGLKTFQEFIAVFTSVRSATRENAKTVSTGLRTIYTRMQRPRTIAMLKQYGIELQDMEGKFIGGYEAAKRLGQGLRGLSSADVRFFRLAEELGGYRQIAKTLPLLKEATRREEALAVATGKTTDLNTDKEKALTGIGRQASQVAETWRATMREMVDSDEFKVVAKSILGITKEIIRLISTLRTLLPMFGAMAMYRMAPGMMQFGKGAFHAMQGKPLPGGAGGAGGVAPVPIGVPTGRVPRFARGTAPHYQQYFASQQRGMTLGIGGGQLAFGALMGGMMLSRLGAESKTTAGAATTGVGQTLAAGGLGYMMGGPYGAAIGAIVVGLNEFADLLTSDQVKNAHAKWIETITDLSRQTKNALADKNLNAMVAYQAMRRSGSQQVARSYGFLSQLDYEERIKPTSDTVRARKATKHPLYTALGDIIARAKTRERVGPSVAQVSNITSDTALKEMASEVGAIEVLPTYARAFWGSILEHRDRGTGGLKRFVQPNSSESRKGRGILTARASNWLMDQITQSRRQRAEEIYAKEQEVGNVGVIRGELEKLLRAGGGNNAEALIAQAKEYGKDLVKSAQIKDDPKRQEARRIYELLVATSKAGPDAERSLRAIEQTELYQRQGRSEDVVEGMQFRLGSHQLRAFAEQIQEAMKPEIQMANLNQQRQVIEDLVLGAKRFASALDIVDQMARREKILSDTSHQRAMKPTGLSSVFASQPNIFKNLQHYNIGTLNRQMGAMGAPKELVRAVQQQKLLYDTLPGIMQRATGMSPTDPKQNVELFLQNELLGGKLGAGLDEDVKKQISLAIQAMFSKESGKTFSDLVREGGIEKIISGASKHIKLNVQNMIKYQDLINKFNVRRVELAQQAVEAEQHIVSLQQKGLELYSTLNVRRNALLQIPGGQDANTREALLFRRQQLINAGGGRGGIDFSPLGAVQQAKHNLFARGGLIERRRQVEQQLDQPGVRPDSPLFDELQKLNSAIAKETSVLELSINATRALTAIETDLANIQKQREAGRGMMSKLTQMNPQELHQVAKDLQAAVHIRMGGAVPKGAEGNRWVARAERGIGFLREGGVEQMGPGVAKILDEYLATILKATLDANDIDPAKVPGPFGQSLQAGITPQKGTAKEKDLLVAWHNVANAALEAQNGLLELTKKMHAIADMQREREKVKQEQGLNAIIQNGINGLNIAMNNVATSIDGIATNIPDRIDAAVVFDKPLQINFEGEGALVEAISDKVQQVVQDKVQQMLAGQFNMNGEFIG